MPESLTRWLWWPLPVRPSLENLSDPDIRGTVALALMLLGAALLALTVSALARRGRIVVCLGVLAIMAWQGPALGLLLVQAYPTSFLSSPTDFTAASIEAGRTVFAGNCVPCHGSSGDGVGGRGRVADLRQPHIWDHPMGDLFWFVSHGIPGPDGALVMPAFEDALPEAARWSAIDYVHALNAGAVARGREGWPSRVIAPDLALSCRGRPARSLADLRGKAIRMILGPIGGAVPPVAPVDGIAVVTVWLPGSDTPPPSGVDCTAQEGAAAYAVLAGAPDGHIVPARFLIDPDGVLRSVRRPGEGGGWSDPAALLDDVRAICTEPLTLDTGDQHVHRH